MNWLTCKVVGEGDVLIGTRHIVRVSSSRERGFVEMWLAAGESLRVLRVTAVHYQGRWQSASMNLVSAALRGEEVWADGG